MIRAPPCSTLCPYTTLFRSLHRPVAGFTKGGCVVVAARGKLEAYACQQGRLKLVLADDCPSTPMAILDAPDPNQFTLCDRSEEHTSELQSRLQLVCRLLLEK